MVALAAELADGAITNWLAPSDLPMVRSVAGPDCELIARIFVCPTPDADTARQIGRRLIAAYLTVPAYAAFHDWLGRGERLRADAAGLGGRRPQGRTGRDRRQAGGRAGGARAARPVPGAGRRVPGDRPGHAGDRDRARARRGRGGSDPPARRPRHRPGAVTRPRAAPRRTRTGSAGARWTPAAAAAPRGRPARRAVRPG